MNFFVFSSLCNIYYNNVYTTSNCSLWGHSKFMSFRASAHTGVGIPQIEGGFIESYPHYLGDCHTSDIGHWFAMTQIN